jgi:hypothetical protein
MALVQECAQTILRVAKAILADLTPPDVDAGMRLSASEHRNLRHLKPFGAGTDQCWSRRVSTGRKQCDRKDTRAA